MKQSSHADIYSPEYFGLSSRTRIHTVRADHIAVVVNRKSRIIMKDGLGILKKTEQIWAKEPDMTISVETNAPVCSKTRAFLNDHGVEILPL